MSDATFGYTLATGRLFCDVSEFFEWCEQLLDRPIFTHEYANEETWDELRAVFETRALEAWKAPA